MKAFYYIIAFSTAIVTVVNSYSADKFFRKLGKYEDVTIIGVDREGVRIMHAYGSTRITEDELNDSEKTQLQEELDEVKKLKQQRLEQMKAFVEKQNNQKEKANRVTQALKDISTMLLQQAIDHLKKTREECSSAPNVTLLDKKIVELQNDLKEQKFIDALSDLSKQNLPPKEQQRLMKLAKEVQSCYEKALQGNAEAQFQMYAYYSKTDGTAITGKPDYGRAMKWLNKSAEQGLPIALYNLGTFYATGEGGVKINKNQAKQYWEIAADKGFVHAQYNLGWGYFAGDFDHGKKNYKLAREWWEKAAEQGDSQSQYNLGALYYHGHGVKEDPEQAKSWWRKAAEQNNPEAIKALFECFNERFGRAFTEEQLLTRSDLTDEDCKRSAKFCEMKILGENYNSNDSNWLDLSGMYYCDKGDVFRDVENLSSRIEFRKFPVGKLALFPQGSVDYSVIVELERITEILTAMNTRQDYLQTRTDYAKSQLDTNTVRDCMGEFRLNATRICFYELLRINLIYSLSIKMLGTKIKIDGVHDYISNPLTSKNYVLVFLPLQADRIYYTGVKFVNEAAVIDFTNLISIK